MTIFNRLVGYLFHFFFSFFCSICCFLTCLFLTFFVLYIIKWSIDQRPNLIYSCFLIHSLFWMFWLAFQLNVACQSTFFSQLTLCALALLHAWIVLHISTGWFNRSPRHHQTSFIIFFLFFFSLSALTWTPGARRLFGETGWVHWLWTCASVMAWLRAHPLINLRKRRGQLYSSFEQTNNKTSRTTHEGYRKEW